MKNKESTIDLPKTGSLFSFYDEITSYIYLGALGHTEILCYKFNPEKKYITLKYRVSINNPIHGISFRGFKQLDHLDRSLNEIAK